MSNVDPSMSETGGQRDGETGTERIADPDDYNLRRRLKQLHTAKEDVVVRKDNALDMEHRLNRKEFSPEDRDRFIVEKVVDYIHELRPLLKKSEREPEFLTEYVTVDGTAVSVQDVIDTRGRVDAGEGEFLPYRASMAIWDICNEYFESVAGAVFEAQPAQPADNPVDPAGRFNE